MQLPPRRRARALGLAAATAALLVSSASPALAAPAPVTGLAAALAPHGAELTWTSSGTGTPVVRDVTGLAEPYDPTSSGRLVAPGSTTDCPAASCALDTGFTNTTTQTYAVWATDADGSAASYVTVAVPVLARVATAAALDPPPATVPGDTLLHLAGQVTWGGQPLPGAHVWLCSTVLGSTTVDTLAGATSAADGSVQLAYAPTRSRSYWLVLPQDAYSLGSTSVPRSVDLQPATTAAVSPSTIAWKQSAVVRGTVSPALGGATVAVQRWSGSAWSAVAYRTVTSTGTWSLTVTPAVGTLRYRGLLLGAPSHLGAVSSVATLTVTPRTLSPGLSGPDVLAVERRLAALHYDVGRVDGYFDADLQHAVTTFEKVERLPRTGTWAAAERSRVQHPMGFVPRYRTAGLSAEVDITRQVLVLARAGVVVRIVDVSTGSGAVYYQQGVRQVAHTPRGSFRIYKKIDGTRISPLGALWRPSYFVGGFAIHGSSSVPPYPASHGCVRITDSEANRLFSTLVIGMPVFVYDE